MKKLIKILKFITPPILFHLINFIHFKLPIVNFRKYWIKSKYQFLKSSFENKDLVEATEMFVKSQSYKLVSNYWQSLNIKNYESILINGLDNYAHNIFTNYHTFLYFDNSLIDKSIENLNGVILDYKIDIFKKHENLNYEQSLNYNLVLLILYENLKKTSSFDFINRLSNIGYLGFNDPYIEIDNVKLTHDKLNSLLDYEMINSIPFFKDKNNKKILEIGAGSGRTSEAILTLNKNLNYVICDIPIAIVIAFKRLKKVFPEKKISILYEIENEEKLIENIMKNDISFIFPHQMKYFTNQIFDLTLAIDCLQDINKKTVNEYFRYIDKFSDYFYYGIWKKTGFFKKYEFKPDNYTIPKNWNIAFKKNSSFPSNFWNICYKIKK